ncbi:unnamed protein product [Notodromas monacha]|uniref:EF-hand domain-containing protein n=1 Tax=Notodromas monacha TaxID=399045 RepID=A0A7R9BEH4_9CRUS|nr:unnamed protein product [Notodromas monacha]CAG0912280.1 unnamed protein product [Notodromas monacha]
MHSLKLAKGYFGSFHRGAVDAYPKTAKFSPLLAFLRWKQNAGDLEFHTCQRIIKEESVRCLHLVALRNSGAWENSRNVVELSVYRGVGLSEPNCISLEICGNLCRTLAHLTPSLARGITSSRIIVACRERIEGSSTYAHFVFRAFDASRIGALSFRDLMLTLSTLLRGTPQEKLHWAFNLYDLNGDGAISRPEMTAILASVYDLLGSHSHPPVSSFPMKLHSVRGRQYSDFQLTAVLCENMEVQRENCGNPGARFGPCSPEADDLICIKKSHEYRIENLSWFLISRTPYFPPGEDSKSATVKAET